MVKKGDKKLIGAWAFYDWANSVYSLVIGTAIFPIYYNSVTGGNDSMITFLGKDFNNATLYSYALSFSFFIVVFLSPVLSSVADYLGNKKHTIDILLPALTIIIFANLKHAIF